MASLQTQDFTTLLRNMVASVQAGSSKLINLFVGSVLRAFLEAVAANARWLQGLVVYLLTLTRAATSVGADLDSFFADFGFYRLAAVRATGPAVFERFTSTLAGLVPAGAVIQTQDGTQQFTVVTDTTNAAYDPTQLGYVIPAGTASIALTVSASNAGTQGNVLANTITALGQSIPGIDTVTNPAAFTDGVDAESDASFRSRFVTYLASLYKATKTAIGFAVTNVQQGLTFTNTENYDYNGTYDPGFFYIVVDDGTGAPPSGLIASVYNAVDATRACGIRFNVFAPVVVTANVGMTITSDPAYTHAVVVGNVATALQNFINSLPLGASLPYTQLAAVAYGVAGVVNASAILLNSATADLSATAKQVIKAGTVTVA